MSSLFIQNNHPQKFQFSRATSYSAAVRSPPPERKAAEVKEPDFTKVKSLAETRLPQIEWCDQFPALDQMGDEDTRHLAFAASSLLAYLKQRMHCNMSLSFRLELQPVGTMWKMVLRISSAAWFDGHLEGLTDRLEAAQIGRTYVESAREKIRNTFPADPSDVAPERSNDDYCCKGDSSAQKGKGCPYKHAIVWCGTPAVRPDGVIQQCCGWYVHGDRLINYEEILQKKKANNTKDLMVVYARADPIRDVIIAPFDHTTNYQMALNAPFWMSLLQTLKNHFDYNSAELVYLNFGVWETQTSEDTRTTDCHAHAHINLTRRAVDEYGKKHKALQGRVNNPEDFLQKECYAIDSRLNSLEIENLSTKIDGLQTSLQTAMDTKFAALTLLLTTTLQAKK